MKKSDFFKETNRIREEVGMSKSSTVEKYVVKSVSGREVGEFCTIDKAIEFKSKRTTAGVKVDVCIVTITTEVVA